MVWRCAGGALNEVFRESSAPVKIHHIFGSTLPHALIYASERWLVEPYSRIWGGDAISAREKRVGARAHAKIFYIGIKATRSDATRELLRLDEATTTGIEGAEHCGRVGDRAFTLGAPPYL